MDKRSRIDEVGFVSSAKRYLITIEGLPSARINDIIVDTAGNQAIVRSLGADHITALSLSGSAKPGDRYSYQGGAHQYYCGEALFGRVIDPLGIPVDDGGSLPPGTIPLQLEVDAPGIEDRVHITEQLFTGTTLVDTLVPIAKGQRQLLFGPLHSGKSTFLTQTVKMQQRFGTVCIYVVLGKPVVGLRKITDAILQAETKTKTIVMAALSDEPAPVIALAPSIAFLFAEAFAARGEHVLVILDDLDAHAKYLREIALLEGRLPSTESYPGDIFYQHAHLMERSGHFIKEKGGGSITALPVIQTDLKNFSDLIPTNLMACTDGHLAFQASLRAEGVYPSINLEQSVTRVGRQSQKTLQKQLTTRIQILLGAYRQQREYAQFSAELSPQTKEVLRRGRIIELLIQQVPDEVVMPDVQVLLLALPFSTFFDGVDEGYVKKNKAALQKALHERDGFKHLRSMAFATIDFDAFIAELERVHALLTSVCQP